VQFNTMASVSAVQGRALAIVACVSIFRVGAGQPACISLLPANTSALTFTGA